MAGTLKQTEAVPAAYPATPAGLSAAATALNPNLIWQRIEAYTSARWTARAVVWTVDGPGEWEPLLTPATVTLAEEWTGTAWQTATPDASPLGGYDLASKTYRITASVGGGTVPVAVNEAFKRLAEYMAARASHPGASSFKTDVGGAISLSEDRSPAWMARAMINSGAADLLRPYRRAA